VRRFNHELLFNVEIFIHFQSHLQRQLGCYVRDSAFYLRTKSAKHDSNMMAAQQYDCDCRRVIVRQYDGHTWKYDAGNTTVQWWQYDSTMATFQQFDRLIPPLFCTSPSYSLIVNIVLLHYRHLTVTQSLIY
jgi:ribosomal protein L33